MITGETVEKDEFECRIPTRTPFFSLPYWAISISVHLNNYSAFRLNPVLVSSISSLFSFR